MLGKVIRVFVLGWGSLLGGGWLMMLWRLTPTLFDFVCVFSWFLTYVITGACTIYIGSHENYPIALGRGKDAYIFIPYTLPCTRFYWVVVVDSLTSSGYVGRGAIAPWWGWQAFMGYGLRFDECTRDETQLLKILWQCYFVCVFLVRGDFYISDVNFCVLMLLRFAFLF